MLGSTAEVDANNIRPITNMSTPENVVLAIPILFIK